MTLPRVSIDGARPVQLKYKGFVTRANAHGHLFKHVLRLAGLAQHKLALAVDEESWRTVIPDPPLITSLLSRRAAARDKLLGVAHCALAKSAPTSDNPCMACVSRVEQQIVDSQFGDLLDAYDRVVRGVLEWAVANASKRDPRLIVFIEPRRGKPRLKGIDNKGTTIIGALDSATGDIRAVSCYRKSHPKAYISEWLDMCRERAGFRGEGLAVELVLASEDETR